MSFKLPPLPYPVDALEPHMSAKTLTLHHDKHHKAYIDALNGLVRGTALADQPLEAVIRATAKDPARATIFNNAAQAWNHDFFWHCMKPAGGGTPKGDVAEALEHGFGGFDKFKDAFSKACIGQFGSGWGWLVDDGGQLKVIATPNAVNPISKGQTALLGCDVWEHAYYLDYNNRRPDFVAAFLDLLVDWDGVACRLTKVAEPVG